MAREGILAPFRPTTQTAANGTQSPAMTATLTTVTPDVARAWLEGNTRNRNLRWAVVDAIVRDILSGNWVLNGETIKISVDGNVIDGQHRLHGIVKAGVPVQSFVVCGLPMEVQDTVDTGRARTLGDQLTLHGNKRAHALAAVAAWAFRWEQGQRSKGGNFKVTHTEAIAYINSHPQLYDAMAFSSRARHSFPLIRETVYGLAWWLLTSASRERGEQFMEKVASGEDIGAGHPAHTLRARLLSAGRNDERLNEHEQLALVVFAWNAHRAGRSLSRLQLPKGGLTPNNFPELK